MRYVVDFDDYCDATIDKLSLLEELKAKYPALKVTLFTIPMRSSTATINAARSLNSLEDLWLQLAPHGWRHTRGECFAWNIEEAADKITRAANMRIDAPVFRAPAWLLDGDVYEACRRLGYVVAGHENHSIYVKGAREYIYTNCPEVRGVHGHLTPVCDNYIDDMVIDGRCEFVPNSTFHFPQEIV